MDTSVLAQAVISFPLLHHSHGLQSLSFQIAAPSSRGYGAAILSSADHLKDMKRLLVLYSKTVQLLGWAVKTLQDFIC